MARSPAVLVAALLALALLAAPAQAKWSEFCVQCNEYLTQGVRIEVSDVANSDWESPRPDHDLAGKVVNPGETLCQHLETNYWSAPAFTLTLVAPATGPEQVRDSARPKLCDGSSVIMGWCRKTSTWTAEVLDYCTVRWSY